MEKINVRVPQSLLAQIDEVWNERGYANKSEFIRDAFRDAVSPQRYCPRKHSNILPKAATSERKTRRCRRTTCRELDASGRPIAVYDSSER